MHRATRAAVNRFGLLIDPRHEFIGRDLKIRDLQESSSKIMNRKRYAEDKDLALRSTNKVSMLNNSLDNRILLNSLGYAFANNTLKKLNGIASRERLASAGRVNEKMRAKLRIKGCYG